MYTAASLCAHFMNFIEKKRQLKPVLMEARNKYDSEIEFRIPKCSNAAAKTCQYSFFFPETITRSFHANRVPVICSDVT
jgi:hypothetical protein